MPRVHNIGRDGTRKSEYKEAIGLANKAVSFMCRCEAHQGYTWSSVTDDWSKNIRKRGRKLRKRIKQILDS